MSNLNLQDMIREGVDNFDNAQSSKREIIDFKLDSILNQIDKTNKRLKNIETKIKNRFFENELNNNKPL